MQRFKIILRGYMVARFIMVVPIPILLLSFQHLMETIIMQYTQIVAQVVVFRYPLERGLCQFQIPVLQIMKPQ